MWELVYQRLELTDNAVLNHQSLVNQLPQNQLPQNRFPQLLAAIAHNLRDARQV
jgi:hypothetical protein